MLQVSWVKCQSGDWCSFDKVDLSNVTAKGVYIIWHAGNPGRVVRVGQGDIADRITKHRNDRQITQYAQNGVLYVTWAAVSSQSLDGVERYLANTWPPLAGDTFPDVAPIAVNSPWA